MSLLFVGPGCPYSYEHGIDPIRAGAFYNKFYGGDRAVARASLVAYSISTYLKSALGRERAVEVR